MRRIKVWIMCRYHSAHLLHPVFHGNDLPRRKSTMHWRALELASSPAGIFAGYIYRENSALKSCGWSLVPDSFQSVQSRPPENGYADQLKLTSRENLWRASAPSIPDKRLHPRGHARTDSRWLHAVSQWNQTTSRSAFPDYFSVPGLPEEENPPSAWTFREHVCDAINSRLMRLARTSTDLECVTK